VLDANSSSRWSGCTFMVSELNSTLSISVTVRVQAWSNTRPTVSSSKYSPAIFLPAKAAFLSTDGRSAAAIVSMRPRIGTGANDAGHDQRSAGRAGESQADGDALQHARAGRGGE